MAAVFKHLREYNVEDDRLEGANWWKEDTSLKVRRSFLAITFLKVMAMGRVAFKSQK